MVRMMRLTSVWFLAACIGVTACRQGPAQSPAIPAALDADGQPARLLSAFYGLDDALPFTANRLCPGAAGRDGMPVILSHTIDEATLQRTDFRVRTQSGAARSPFCVTLAPARDAGERRTVLLVGDFGDPAADPPALVEVVDDILSDGVTGGPVNFRGTSIGVIPLAAGPTLILAESVAQGELPPDGTATGTSCPDDSAQVVRVTWSGGVRRPDGSEAGDGERTLYRVTVERPDGARVEVVPDALADLDDRDNNHLLCLRTPDPAVGVSFPAGHLIDPNRDLNPSTRVAVTTRSPSTERPPVVLRDRRWP